MDFKDELHRQLTEATTLVWQMQNALADIGSLTPQVMRDAARLHYISGNIHAHVERWALWIGDQVSDLVRPASRDDLVAYCLLHGASIAVRKEVDGKWQSVMFDKLNTLDQALWITRWWEEGRYPVVGHSL